MDFLRNYFFKNEALISWAFISSKLDFPVIKTLERHSLNVKKNISLMFWLQENYSPIPAPLLSVIEPGIFLHDLTFGLCFGLEGCEDNFDMPLFYLYAIELEERKNVRNICHVYPWHFRIFLLLSSFFLTYYVSFTFSDFYLFSIPLNWITAELISMKI